MHRRRMRGVSVWRINILPQMRKTFDKHEQQELTDSIGTKGVLNAPIVALFTKSEADEYLAIINRLWKRTLSCNDLKASIVRGKKHWYVLLAGERRTRSYQEHVRRKRMPRELQVTVHEHIDPCDAVEIQLTENSHRRPPPHEAAYAYAEYWALLETRGIKLSHAAFARRVGSNAGTIKNALLFARLPTEIRHASAGRWSANSVKTTFLKNSKRKLPYGIAVGLARLLEASVMTEQQAVDHMVDTAIRDRASDVEKFSKDVARRIAEKGQELLTLMAAEAEREALLIGRRRTVEGSISRILSAEESYVAKVIELINAGYLGVPKTVFASGSVRERFLRLAELMELAYPLIWKRPSPRARKALSHIRTMRTAVSEAVAHL